MLPLALWIMAEENKRAKLLNDWRYGLTIERTAEGQVRRSALVQMLDSRNPNPRPRRTFTYHSASDPRSTTSD